MYAGVDSSVRRLCGGWRVLLFLFKQKTAYEMRISDWSSDVCSSDLHGVGGAAHGDVEAHGVLERGEARDVARQDARVVLLVEAPGDVDHEMPGFAEQPLAVGMGRQHRAVARPRQAERSEERRVGNEGVRTSR